MSSAPPPRDRRLHRLLWGGVLLIGIAARLTHLFSGLEYDEIWTLENFAPLPLSRILTDLALPNNHPLNTLGVWICATLFQSPWSIRLPALLAGLGALPLMALVAFLWSRKWLAAWVATLIFALCTPVILYAQQARGYSIQLFFLLLFAAGFLLARKFRPAKPRFLPEIMVFLGGAGAILTLPTSILYLGVITLIGYFLCRSLPFSRLPLRTVLTFGVVLTALWYGVNYQALQAARVWGIPVTGFQQFLELIADTMMQLNGPAVLLLALCGLLLRSRRSRPLLLFSVVAFGSALVTNAGGGRVYLPLTVPTAILAGMGAEAIFRRLYRRFPRPWSSALLLLLLAALLFWNGKQNAKEWPVRDWYLLHEELRRLAPEELFALDAGDGYPYCWNNHPGAVEDYRQRLLNTERERSLVSFLPPGHLNGIDIKGGSRPLHLQEINSVPREQIGPDFTVCRYRLSEIFSTPPAGSDLLVVIRPLQSNLFRQFIQEFYLAYPTHLRMNSWLTLPYTIRRQPYQAATLILHCDEPERLDWKSFRNRIRGAISVYRILPMERKKAVNHEISDKNSLEKR